MNVQPERTPLSLAPGLRLRLDAVGHVRVDTPLGGVVDAGPDGLIILALFSRPTTVAAALEALEAMPAPRPDRAPAASLVALLEEAGAIVGADLAEEDRFGWTDPAEQARMLDDRRRTDAFVHAIRESVRPDDVVVDIGTGSGILAITAALAGARHVYAIEASGIAALAGRAFEANGVADRVTLIEGWSTDVELPERATLLVSEIIGAEPLEEDILRTTLDARRRLLTADARLIPHALSLAVRAVSVPQLGRWASRVEAASIEAWREAYGVDLSVLWDRRRRTPLAWTVEGMTAATWPILGPSTTLVEFDLTTVASARVEAQAEVIIERPGVVDAIVLTFDARLTETVTLQGPPWIDQPSSWDTSVWFLPEGIAVHEGARLLVAYDFGSLRATDGLSCRLATA